MKTMMLVISAMTLAAVVGVNSFGQSAVKMADQKMPGASPHAPKSLSPDEWVVSQEDMWIPVIDKLGKELQSARRSFVKKDNKSAEKDILAGAKFLRGQLPAAQDVDKGRLMEAAGDLETLAGKIKLDQVTSVKEVDQVFIKAYDADTAQRWLVSETTEWFPLVEAPQQHFLAASTTFAKKDLKSAATHIRKAAAFIRLESARTAAGGKEALVASARDLDALAGDVEKGTVTDASKLKATFAGAQDAMAKSHYLKAAEGWAAHDYAKARAELKASEKHLENTDYWKH